MILEQSRIFIVFFTLGLLLSFIFDFFRALRKEFKTNNTVTYIEDLIFLCISGALFIKSILVFSYGQIRFYIFLAIIFGISIYFLTIGNLCAIIFKVILDFLKKFILCFIRIFKFPVKFIINNLQKLKRPIIVSKNKS